MLYMVIEHFHNADEIYRRFRENGRMLPDGLEYLNSWVEPNRKRCFQLMRTHDVALLHAWVQNWNDLADFEFVEVISSQEAAARTTGSG